MIQLDFFEPKDDLELLKDELQLVKESTNKVRKGIFARHNEIAKMLLDISIRLEVIERNICKI